MDQGGYQHLMATEIRIMRRDRMTKKEIRNNECVRI
jgi:hypothetical protein